MNTSQRSAKPHATLAPEFGNTAMCDAECTGEWPPFADLPPLQLSIVNVPFRSECGGFDGGCLEAFFRERDVESAREYFYVHEGRPHLSCWVEWREREQLDAEDRERSTTPSRNAARADIVLTAEEEPRFELLRIWRLERAREAAVPAYRILSDRSLRHIVRARPERLEQLAQTPGIPGPTLERYGPALLALVTRPASCEPPREAATESGSGADGNKPQAPSAPSSISLDSSSGAPQVLDASAQPPLTDPRGDLLGRRAS